MSTSLEALRARIEEAMTADRPDLLRQWQQCQRLAREGKPFDRSQLRLEERLESSLQRVASRRASVPALSYPEALPVSARREELLEVIRNHQVVVVAGETGSGKTTQRPKMCLELGRGVHGRIGHTQLRYAARSVAARTRRAECAAGEAVGYQCAFPITARAHPAR